MNMSRFSKEKESQILEMYKEGKTQKEIANYFGTYNTSIRRVLLRYNIIPRGNDKVQRLCKHNPFKKHDEYSDYFLGLLLTDGCISSNITKKSKSINLYLNEKDIDVIEKYRNWISPNSKIVRILQKINNSYMCGVSIINEEIENYLRRLGNFTNKSYNCKIYKPLNWNILRGIFDGDGGFHPNCGHLDFFICGKSLIFLKQIKIFLDKYNVTSYIRERKNGQRISLYYLEVYKIQDVIKIGENMYKNASIFLNRKFDKWLSFYENRGYKYTLNSGKE